MHKCKKSKREKEEKEEREEREEERERAISKIKNEKRKLYLYELKEGVDASIFIWGGGPKLTIMLTIPAKKKKPIGQKGS